MPASAVRVAERHLVRLAARRAMSSSGAGSRTAADDRVMQATLTAIGKHFYLPQHQGKVAFMGLAKKLSQLAAAFKKLPRLWEDFKHAVGIESLSDIPKAIKELAAKGKSLLHSVIDKMFSVWPLKLYTLEKGKLKGINALLDRLVSKHPKLKAFLAKATHTVGEFGETVRKYAPHIVGAVMLAVYLYIWFSVAEFEWDLKSLVDAVAGRLDFPSFLASLPASAIGAIISAVSNVGTFSLLPYTIAARILYLLGSRYLTFSGGSFHFDREALQEDFGIELKEATI